MRGTYKRRKALMETTEIEGGRARKRISKEREAE